MNQKFNACKLTSQIALWRCFKPVNDKDNSAINLLLYLVLAIVPPKDKGRFCLKIMTSRCEPATLDIFVNRQPVVPLDQTYG